MTTCKECKFYRFVDGTRGTCFSMEVPPNMDTNKCPRKAFQPRK